MKLAYAEQSLTFTDFWLVRKNHDFISKLTLVKPERQGVKYFLLSFSWRNHSECR